MKAIRRFALAALALPMTLSLSTAANEAAATQTTGIRCDPAAMKWWSDARFGLFVHWGLYSVAGGDWNGHPVKGNEHFMIHEHLSLKEYSTLAARFNPEKFDADEWVLAAKNAGMKYIVITTKHHEGFAMFDSPSSAYNIVKATPYGKDPMAALAKACAKHGVALCFYYSLGRDWEDPDVPTNWPTKGGRSNIVDFPDEDAKVFSRYFERKVKPQIRELLTQYGPVGVLWFDTPERIPAEESKELRKLIHELQPNCIVNERIGNGFGDYTVSEQKLHAENSSAPWEACVTLSGGWGYNRHDDRWKSAEVVVRQLIDVASTGGNFLLNVGPTGDGVIPAPALERLAAVGRWMKVNGEAIYGTKPWELAPKIIGESKPKPKATAPTSGTASTLVDTLNDVTSQATHSDLRFTAKDRTVYVFARSWNAPSFTIPSLNGSLPKIQNVRLLGSASRVEWSQDDDGMTIVLPREDQPEIPIRTFKLDL